MDYDLDTLVTSSSRRRLRGSVGDGGRRDVRALGPILTPTGQRINSSPTADIDIYSIPSIPTVGFANRLVGVSGQTFFKIDLFDVNPAVPAGSVTNIVTEGVFTLPDDANDIINIAAAPISYEAENATVGGGARVDNSFQGFSGTGYVSLGSGFAGGFVNFQVNHEHGRGGILPHLRQWE